MSLAESCASSPSMYASDSPSPVPSASQTPHHYTNGYHSSIEFVNFGSPGSHGQNSDEHHSFIKRPLNAYMIWTVEERKKILAKDPKMKMNDVSRIMGEKWKSLSEKEKKPYFEQSKQYKLDHKRALKENPDLLYRPQRKKPNRNSIVKQDIQIENGSSSMVAAATGSVPGVYMNAGMAPVSQQRYGVAQANGTLLVTQPVLYSPMQLQSTSQKTAMSMGSIQTPQSSLQRNFQVQTSSTPHTHLPNHLHHQQQLHHGHQLQQSQQPSVNAAQMLDMYYTSLCQPAFPEPGETNDMASPQYYLDQYQQLNLQSASAALNHVGVPAGYAAYGTI